MSAQTAEPISARDFTPRQAREAFEALGVSAEEAAALAGIPAARALLAHVTGYNPVMQQFVLRGPVAEEPFIVRKRREVEALYGFGSFGEILCRELHGPPCDACGRLVHGLTFKELARKWNVSLPVLGELIWDHCKQLEE